jgi:hypothetical protein
LCCFYCVGQKQMCLFLNPNQVMSMSFLPSMTLLRRQRSWHSMDGLAAGIRSLQWACEDPSWCPSYQFIRWEGLEHFISTLW